MSENNSDDVVEKLDKVAGSLETATSQLAGVVTQQQLDVLKEASSSLKSELETCKESIEILTQRLNDCLDDITSMQSDSKEALQQVEKDFAGVRALSLTGFALGTITLIGLILCAVYL
tara:strand:+ start:320 stop:673 length:354 start_codon:yes stop_codon:yes gene_type:complete